MVAKAAVLNQIQFNGAYGCPRCLAKGRSATSKRVWIYPFEMRGRLRSANERNQHVVSAIRLNKPVFGIKGIVRTVLHTIVKNHISPSNRPKVSALIRRFVMPSREFRRQPRGLDRLKFRKASEIKWFLFYGFLALRPFVHPNIFGHFSCLSRAISILIGKPFCSSSLDMANSLPSLFCEICNTESLNYSYWTSCSPINQ